MKILVLADTHIPSRARTLPPALVGVLHEADLILHAGDITAPQVLEELSKYARVVAVAGNNDRDLAGVLPLRTVVDVAGFRVGVVHGDGTEGTTLSRAAAAFEGEQVDCVVFGHSHQPLCIERDGVLYLNPGSPTDRRREPRFSYAWLLTGRQLRAELVFLDRAQPAN